MKEEGFELAAARNESRETFRRLAAEAGKLKRLSELKALKLNEREINFNPAGLIVASRENVQASSRRD